METSSLHATGHRTLWNSEESRIEMHLESRRDQHVRIAAAHLDLDSAKYETVHTENSYKFTHETVRALLERADFEVEQSWTDERR
jgi:L-histidine N-alpha-methyltransferase